MLLNSPSHSGPIRVASLCGSVTCACGDIAYAHNSRYHLRYASIHVFRDVQACNMCCSDWKAWVSCCNRTLESTLRPPNIPHPCLRALVCQHTSSIARFILLVENCHVEHGASQVLPGLFHGKLLGMTLKMQLPALTSVNIAFMVHNRSEIR